MPHQASAVVGRADDRHEQDLIKAGRGGCALPADRSKSKALISSGLSRKSPEQSWNSSNSCIRAGSESNGTSTPAAVTNDSSMSCIAPRSRASGTSQSSSTSSSISSSSRMSQSNVHRGSSIAGSIGSSRTRAASLSIAAPDALAARHAAVPNIRHRHLSRHNLHPAATRRLQYSAHHLNETIDTRSSASHDTAPHPQVGLPPGLLGWAADGGLASRAGASTQHLDGVQTPARASDISLAPAGKACLTFDRMSDMLNRSIQELLLTHSRADFLQSVQVILTASATATASATESLLTTSFIQIIRKVLWLVLLSQLDSDQWVLSPCCSWAANVFFREPVGR